MIAFTSVLTLSVLTVPSHFSATVGATRSTQQFRANDRITFQWQSVSGQPTTFTLTNAYQNISLEEGVGSPAKVVYQTTAASGSFAFISDGAPYVFSCACGSGISPSLSVHVYGTIATPIL
ncbi:MAG: hypothetical protein L3K23_02640 [Thermoplasmata archaeon]|nr:hypothetical protein [Thermoplasmata archaeon]